VKKRYHGSKTRPKLALRLAGQKLDILESDNINRKLDKDVLPQPVKTAIAASG
jgi:hypothetical protein